VYPKDVNEDVLDEDGTWTRNYDDESTESSSTASTYENVEESIDDNDEDDYTDDPDEENVDIHVESKIDHVKKAKRRKKQEYKFRKRMSKWQRLHESYGKNVNDYALKASVVAGKRRVLKWNQLKPGAKVRFGSLEDNPLTQIHKKWGHLSESRIKLAYRKHLVNDSQFTYDDIKNLSLPTCRDCMMGRMSAAAKKPTTDHPWKTFEKIACDYKGPFKKSIWNGYTGYYLFSDYHSDYVWAYPVKRKDQQLEALQAFWREHVECQRKEVQKEMMVVFQSDMNTITRSSTVRRWLNEHKVRLQFSTPYKKSENGQIERDVRNVMDKARTLLASYDVPGWFWWYAIKHAVWLINRSPTSNNSNKSPIEIVYDVKPSVDEMIPFYCPGFYHITKEEREPRADWKAKAKSCRFLGYSDESKGYIIYDIGSKKAGIYHTDGRYVEGRSDICWDSSLVELWYNGANDLSRGAILDPEDQSEYIPESAEEVSDTGNEEFLLSSIDEDDSDSYLPHNIP
jgi:hypothetical protein